MSVFPARTDPSHMMASSSFSFGCRHQVSTCICLLLKGVNLNDTFDRPALLIQITPDGIKRLIDGAQESIIIHPVITAQRVGFSLGQF